MRLIEVQVNGLFLTQNQASGVILKESFGDRSLPIIIGEYEAQSIALGLENIQPPRPITHDLLINVLDILDADLESVVVTDLKNNTYYAILKMNINGKMLEVDSRPSDAIAIAVRKNVPIYVTEDVMVRAAIYDNEIEHKDTDEQPENAFSVPDITPLSKLDQLKKELDEAVAKEDYELAAKLRDEIKKLESLQ
ncbi:MAG: bifunctional nuclease family protein [Calditrichia bacterium]